tara:strand:+ start:144 stop:602 length:459 start_codon:yes stop_codon:yes gene_type:complete
MSFQEACQLIFQCGAIGKDGEISLLEMGRPIKILQMAKDLIRLSGLEPEVDIPIVFTGLRPGKKLYEELSFLNEHKVRTTHKKIMILKEFQLPAPWNFLKDEIIELISSAKQLNTEKIQSTLKQIIPSYKQRICNPHLKERDSFYYLIKAKA